MKYVLALLSMLIAYPIFSQDSVSIKVQLNGVSTNSYIETKFRENFQSKLSNIGQFGTCLVKFKVSKENNVKDIEISGVNNSTLYEFITDVLMESSGLWSVSAEVKVGQEEVSFLVPITYVLQKNGKAERIANDDSTFLSIISKVNQDPQNIIVLPQIIFISPFMHSYGKGRVNTDL